MRISTKHKIALARLAYFGVMRLRRLTGRDHRAEVRRGGINWSLDLREGIDFAIYLTGYFEPRTVAAYRRLLTPGGVAIDIGANMGAHTLHLANCVGRDGCVLTFEPALEPYRRLIGNIARNPHIGSRIRPMQTMLVASPDATPEPATYASWPLHPQPDAHHLHLGVALSTDGASASTLDDAVAATGLDRVDLIKLDVDGYELEVLQGALTTLEHHRPDIILEFCPYTLEEQGQEPSEMPNLLRKLGYQFYDLTGMPIMGSTGGMSEIPAGYSVNVIAKATRSPIGRASSSAKGKA